MRSSHGHTTKECFINLLRVTDGMACFWERGEQGYCVIQEKSKQGSNQRIGFAKCGSTLAQDDCVSAGEQ
jgi:hypothetical protein